MTSASASPTAEILKPGEFTFEPATGGAGTISIPGQPDPEVEKLRALANGPATTYLTAHVDNRQGTGNVNMYGVSIFTPEGKELKYEGVSNYIDKLRPSDAPAEVYNQFIELSNERAENASPKEVADFVLVGPPVPEVFTGVTVYATGAFDPVEAKPAK